MRHVNNKKTLFAIFLFTYNKVYDILYKERWQKGMTQRIVKSEDFVSKQYEIKARISQVIKNSGKPLKLISEETAIGYNTLSSYAQGTRTPKIDAMHTLANYFGVSINFLMCIDEITSEDLNLDEIFTIISEHIQASKAKAGEQRLENTGEKENRLTPKQLKNTYASEMIAYLLQTIRELETLNTIPKMRELNNIINAILHLTITMRKGGNSDTPAVVGKLTMAIHKYMEAFNVDFNSDALGSEEKLSNPATNHN